MKKIEYDLPVFENEDIANLNEYSQKVADAIKIQIDKFGQPLTFKGTLENLTELEYITEKKNGDIYEIKDIEELYIFNGERWVVYSDTLKIKIEGFEVIVAEELPTENIQEKTIYLVPSIEQAEKNIYDEFMYINNQWEQIGSTSVDLTDYYTKSEVDNKIDNIQALPEGGTTGQVLTKASAMEGDATWETIITNEVFIGNEEEAPETAKIIIEDNDSFSEDDFPVGTIVEYNGAEVPDGYIEVEDNNKIELININDIITLPSNVEFLESQHLYKQGNHYWGYVHIHKTNGNFNTQAEILRLKVTSILGDTQNLFGQANNGQYSPARGFAYLYLTNQGQMVGYCGDNSYIKFFIDFVVDEY